MSSKFRQPQAKWRSDSQHLLSPCIATNRSKNDTVRSYFVLLNSNTLKCIIMVLVICEFARSPIHYGSHPILPSEMPRLRYLN